MKNALLQFLLTLCFGAAGVHAAQLQVQRGAINQVAIVQEGQVLAVYCAPAIAEMLLMTDARRDAGWTMPRDAKTRVVAPQASRELIEQPERFWTAFITNRFHDYAQQTTKVLGEAATVSRWVKENDTIEWRGVTVRVLDTPGFARGSVSYIAELDGKKVAFTGDLIYGDGKLLDLYSVQDAIPTAKVGGYHGYGGRLGDLIQSLRKLQALKPDLLVPARGPVIPEPAAAIDKLIARVQALYKNYLSTNALHWYFKEERMRICGERVLGTGAKIDLMPYALNVEAPSWVFNHSTSRLLISDDGHGFLLDCGYQRVIDAVQDLMAKKLVKKVEGIFVTHMHDDHTDMVQKASEIFQCPIYATTEYADVLARPEAYHLPALTANAMKNLRVMKDGEKLAWRGFDLTFHFYPGQTLYHGALLAEKKGEKPIFFIGDSFAPSGLDDYSLQNRNLLHEDSGYLYCLKKIRTLPEGCWLMNQHIPPVFRYSEKELAMLEKRYRERIAIQRDLFPWDDPNYGVDEQWAVFYPRVAKAGADQMATAEVRVVNHSPVRRTFTITPRAWNGASLVGKCEPLTLASRQSGAAKVSVRLPAGVKQALVTADIQSPGMEFRDWIEALVIAP